MDGAIGRWCKRKAERKAQREKRSVSVFSGFHMGSPEGYCCGKCLPSAPYFIKTSSFKAIDRYDRSGTLLRDSFE